MIKIFVTLNEGQRQYNEHVMPYHIWNSYLFDYDSFRAFACEGHTQRQTDRQTHTHRDSGSSILNFFQNKTLRTKSLSSQFEKITKLTKITLDAKDEILQWRILEFALTINTLSMKTFLTLIRQGWSYPASECCAPSECGALLLSIPPPAVKQSFSYVSSACLKAGWKTTCLANAGWMGFYEFRYVIPDLTPWPFAFWRVLINSDRAKKAFRIMKFKWRAGSHGGIIHATLRLALNGFGITVCRTGREILHRA